MSSENLTKEICRFIVQECVSRVKESVDSVSADPASALVLSMQEAANFCDGKSEERTKEICATSIYHFMRLLQGDFGYLRIGKNVYRFELTVRTEDDSENFLVIPPDELDELGPEFLEQMSRTTLKD